MLKQETLVKKVIVRIPFSKGKEIAPESGTTSISNGGIVSFGPPIGGVEVFAQELVAK